MPGWWSKKPRQAFSAINGSHTIFCKEWIPKVALINIRWAAVNTTIWRCDTTAEMKKSSGRVAPKESPDAQPNHEEASSSSTCRPGTILKETLDTRVGVRDLNPAGVKHPAGVELK